MCAETLGSMFDAELELKKILQLLHTSQKTDFFQEQIF